MTTIREANDALYSIYTKRYANGEPVDFYDTFSRTTRRVAAFIGADTVELSGKTYLVTDEAVCELHMNKRRNMAHFEEAACPEI